VTIEPDLVTRPWAIIDGLDTALKEYLALLPKKTGRKKTATRRPRKTKAVK
jgi:hypothetical protein